MREFPSVLDYKEFASSVTNQARYIFEPHVEEFLQTVIETGVGRIYTLDAGSILYRAQLGCDTTWESADASDPASMVYKVIDPYGPERMKPPKERAREGRVNPKGIPCLYLADEPNTAMAETRPWLGSYVSVAKFQTTASLQVMRLPEARHDAGLFFDTPPFVRKPDATGREKAVWGDIGLAFSEPVMPAEDTADYAPTQILAETFKKIGCQGIRYKSRLGKGCSFALFDLNSAEFINCRIFDTTVVSFLFRRCADLYFPDDNCPELDF